MKRFFQYVAAILALALAAAASAGDSRHAVLLNVRQLDTTLPEIQAMRKSEGTFAGKRLHLVQFAGPILPEWRAALTATGARIVNYIPNNAYLVYGDAAAIAKVQALAAGKSARWDAAYLDEYKIQPGAAAALTNLYSVQLVADAAANAETIALLSLTAKPKRVLDFVNLTAKIAPSELAAAAARPDVISIRALQPVKKLDERQDQIVTGNISGNSPIGPGYLPWLRALGFSQQQFDDSGFIIDVADSGIDNGTTTPSHFGLYGDGETNGESRVYYARLVGTPNSGSTLKGCDGHGTLNAHIAAGFDDSTNFPFADSSGFAYGFGVCPFAHLGSSVLFDPYNWTSPDFTTLESSAYQSGARIQSDSWGYGGSGGGYGVAAQEFDALVRDAQPAVSACPASGNQEMVIVFADGDSGPSTGTVTEPSTAKNVIAVGGAENVRFFGGADGCGVGDNEAVSANEMATLSSRGPCTDGRHKPDLVAPATHITGGLAQAPDPGPLGDADPCFTGADVCGGVDSIYYPPGQQFYTASSGTSHSAPAVTGACALLRQYFLNRACNPPSAAMTKACLMNSARYLTGATANDTLWSDGQGMGELDLGAALDGRPQILRDELATDMFAATGQSRTFTGVVADTNAPFLITLAWTDAPGSTTGAAYNNDLDLTVTVGGQTYLGNVFSGAWSTNGGLADAENNVESVFLPPATAGAFSVTVTAANINSIGVPNGSNALLQDFALVIHNAIGNGPPKILLDSATLSSENCEPANGVMDPGETVTVQFALQNIGLAATTNLVAALQSGQGIESPSAPAEYGILQPGGAAVSRPMSFTAEGSCGGTATAMIQLTDGGATVGWITNTFTLGQFVPDVTFSENFDEVAAPDLPDGWTTVVEGGQHPWATTNVPDSLPNSVFAAASANTGISDLISPVIPIASAAAQLRFRNDYELETNADAPYEAFDGGVLEIQIGTNGFEDIVAAGGTFLSNGYNQTIAPISADDNPLPNRSCWSGNSLGFATTIIQLPAAAAGQHIQLRWRCATDTGNANGSVGWWVDTISIVDGGGYECCQGLFSPGLINPRIIGTNFIFSFQSAAGQSYSVESATNLSSRAWTPLETVTGNGTVLTLTNSLGLAQTFYRLISFPAP